MDYGLEGFRTKAWDGLAPGMLPAGTNSLTELSGRLE